MKRRWLVAAAAAVALLMGCKSAPPRWSSHRTAPDPDRWERAACHLEQYPPELDSRAFARARLLDVDARREGSFGTSATDRLLREREVFDARCATWRAASAAAGPSGNDPAGQRERGGWTSL